MFKNKKFGKFKTSFQQNLIFLNFYNIEPTIKINQHRFKKEQNLQRKKFSQ